MSAGRYPSPMAVMHVACLILGAGAAHADDSPRDILQSAIKAHGGEEKLAKTVTGKLVAKASFALSPDLQATASWEESFELPRRYRRTINAQRNGENRTMEYAITDGNGWIRQDGGAAKDWKGEKLPLALYWEATLARLPLFIADKSKIQAGGKEIIADREALGIQVSADAPGTDATLFFDARSRLLAKAKCRMLHPLSQQQVDVELFYSDYKEVSGVQYPMRLATYIGGKKVVDLEIANIEFLEKLDDKLFVKPQK